MSTPVVRRFEYDVALSFAGEDRMHAERLATLIRDSGLRVFYDRWEQANLWGKDLYQHLSSIYSGVARFCVIFISSHYAEKAWTNHELRSAQARAFQENAEYILPVRLDDTQLPGMPLTIGYIDLRRESIERIAEALATKLSTTAQPPAERQSAPPLNQHYEPLTDGVVVDLGSVYQCGSGTTDSDIRFSVSNRRDREIKITAIYLSVRATVPIEEAIPQAPEGPLIDRALHANINHQTATLQILPSHHVLKPGETDGFKLIVSAEEGYRYEVYISVEWHPMPRIDQHQQDHAIDSGPIFLTFPFHSPRGLLLLAARKAVKD